MKDEVLPCTPYLRTTPRYSVLAVVTRPISEHCQISTHPVASDPTDGAHDPSSNQSRRSTVQSTRSFFRDRFVTAYLRTDRWTWVHVQPLYVRREYFTVHPYSTAQYCTSSVLRTDTIIPDPERGQATSRSVPPIPTLFPFAVVRDRR
jgi:hypothetical protein